MALQAHEMTRLVELFAGMCLVRAFEQRVSSSTATARSRASSTPRSARRRSRSASARRCATTTTSRRPTAATATASPRARTSTATMAELFGEGRPASAAARAARCTSPIPREGILGANAIVGASLPLAVGAGLSSKLLGQGRVAVAFFGEGAVNQGAFHEAAQPGRDLGPARALRLREQRLRRVHRQPHDDARCRASPRAAPAYGIEVGDGRRQRRRGGVTRPRGDAVGALPRRRRPGPDRSRDLPLAGPLRGRRPDLQARRRRSTAWRERDPAATRADAAVESQGLAATRGRSTRSLRDAGERIERAVEFARALALPRPRGGLRDVFAD